MSWLEMRLDSTSEQAEKIEESLLSCGALAVTYTDAGDQPILEPGVGEMPLWPDIVLVALFEADVQTGAKTAELAANLKQSCNQDLPAHRWDILEDRVWEREWLKHHKPVKFGEAFWVFHETVASPDEKTQLPTLLLDPGLAFGTGSHPTTALCLNWIAKQNWAAKQLIDYGCGSGILAVAASLLDCQHVVCTDIDPQALAATRANAERNAIKQQQLEIYLAGQEPETHADVLVANILAGPLVQLAESFAAKVKPGGEICLSGILENQKDEILNAYSPWFDSLNVTARDGWLCVTGKRRK